MAANSGHILPEAIDKIARKNGATDANASAGSVRRVRKILEDDFTKPEILTTRIRGRKSSYRLNLSEPRYDDPSREADSGRNSESNGTPTEIEEYRKRRQSAQLLWQKEEQPRRTSLSDRDSDYDEHIRKAMERVSALRLPKDGNIKPVQAATALDITLSSIRRISAMGFIKPGYANDHHPGMTRDDLIAIVYFTLFKQRLNEQDRKELSRSVGELIAK